MNWNELSLFEQLSNVAGEVHRMIDTRNAYLHGGAKKDYSEFYFNKVKELVDRTIRDPKNQGREKELLDEIHEIERYRAGEEADTYILRYWDQYTRAIS